MKKHPFAVLLLLLVCAAQAQLALLQSAHAQTAAPASAARPTAEETGRKTAIVIVSYGAAAEEARQPLLEFEKNVQAAYPNLPVLRAFTSARARDAVRGTGAETPSLPGALSILADTGYSRVAVLPAFVLPDSHYDAVLATAESFTGLPQGLASVEVARPLLGSDEDAYDIAALMMEVWPVEAKSGEAVVFAGQKAEGRGSLAYPALSWALFRQGKRGSLYMVVSINDEESLRDCLNILRLNKIKTVRLIPLTATADERTLEDLYGASPQSLSSKLKAESFEVKAHRQGLDAEPGIAAIWRVKLQTALDSLQQHQPQ